MAKKKAPVKGVEKQKNNPPKAKLASTANIYHRDVLAGLEKKYRLALRMKNYEKAARIYNELGAAHKEHRHLIHRKEYVIV